MANIRFIHRLDDYAQRVTTNVAVLSCLGLGFLFVISAFVPLFSATDLIRSVLIGVGGSLVATSFAVFVTSRFQIRDARVRQIMEHWGLYGIYDTRQMMNPDANVEIELMKKHLDFIAWGLTGFLSRHKSLVEEKVKNGLKIRILTLEPDSPHVRQRSIEEDSVEGQIEQNIRMLAAWVSQLKKIAKSESDVHIRYYKSLPQSHYMRVDENIYIGPYLYKVLSQQTVSFSFKRGEMYSFYTGYFDKLWSDDQFSHD